MPTPDQPWTGADYNDPTVYDSRFEPLPYKNSERGPVHLGYHRYNQMRKNDRRWKLLKKTFGFVPTDDIAVVGAGFGWGAECGNALGLHCCCCDSSQYVQDMKDQTEEANIRGRMLAAGLDPESEHGQAYLAAVFDGGPCARVQIEQQDCSTPGSRNQFKAAFGVSKWDWVLTEDVLTCCSDAEVLNFVQSIDDMGAQKGVIHLVTPKNIRKADQQHPDFNWKTGAQWLQLLISGGFSHYVIGQVGQGILIDPDDPER